ncbi:hypothetical protein JTE90_012679 [Oedothorax gibbosus]|uniref:Uncharacterized protein n=1 Tax=Oedothorax gibbosus TaxID=931172 RepID=A0AAV6W0T7_9ARAC|nr:hypothetical protein JTE90_012679 [Oedothorax gibbosus]
MSALVLFSKTDLNHGRRFPDRFSRPLGPRYLSSPTWVPFHEGRFMGRPRSMGYRPRVLGKALPMVMI